MTPYLSFWSELQPQTRTGLIETGAVLLLFVVIRWVLLSVVKRRVRTTVGLYQWKKTVTYTCWILFTVTLGIIWFKGFRSLTTYFGLLSAGIAIALQDLLINFAGWLFILWRRPFQVGDRVEIAGLKGDVIDLRIFQFTLLEVGNWVQADQSTGRVIHVPNGKVFKEAQANYSRGFRYIWHEIPVMVTFESDWKSAKAILLDIVKRRAEHLSASAKEKLLEAASRYMIFYDNLTPTVYTSVADSGVVLTLRFLCDPRRRRTTEQEMWEDILEAFAAREDMDFAYPSVRYYDNLSEGKPEARAQQASPDNALGANTPQD